MGGVDGKSYSWRGEKCVTLPASTSEAFFSGSCSDDGAMEIILEALRSLISEAAKALRHHLGWRLWGSNGNNTESKDSINCNCSSWCESPHGGSFTDSSNDLVPKVQLPSLLLMKLNLVSEALCPLPLSSGQDFYPSNWEAAETPCTYYLLNNPTLSSFASYTL